MTQLSQSLPVGFATSLDDQGRLTGDLACRSCGYNLRGIHASGECPECDTSVGRSVYGDSLQYCEPRWMKSVARGANLLLCAIVLNLFLRLALAVLVSSVGLAAVVDHGATILMFVIVAIQAAGFWLATMPDPGLGRLETAYSSRRIARVALLTSIALNLATMLLGFLGTADQALLISILGISLVSIIMFVAGAFALLNYGRSIALRIPDRKLASQTRVVMWGWPISLAVVSMTSQIAAWAPVLGATSTSLETMLFGIAGSVT